MSSFVLEPERSLVPLFAFLAILTSAAIFRHINRSSLNQVPHAHWSCGVSSAWVLWQRYRGKELKILEAKHRKLGPILRVGPADLSINSYEHGVRPIYNGSFEKPEYFRFYRYYGRKTSFSSMKRHDHSMRRKRVSAALAKTALFTSEPLRTTVDQILYQRLLPLIEGHQGLSLGILPLCYALSLDALTSTLLGAPAGTKYLLDLPSVGLWLENYELMYCKQAFWPQELPGWTRALRKIGVDMLPRSYYTSREALEEWLLEICDRAELDITVMNPTGLSKEPASLYQVLKAAVEIDSPQMSREEQRLEIASELFDQISGAREVLGLVLAYTILYISQNPDAQEKLRNEVLACMPRAKSEDATYHDDRGGDAELKEAQSPAPASLDRLPYLSAVLKESFRMRPNSTPLPRVTPQDRSVSLAGFEIPPSTRVNVFQWFIHRNPETFDCVDEWHPERWISDSGTLKVGSDQPLWAFGSGSRMCVGASLSQYLMKHTLAAIYSRFSSKIVAKKQNVQEPGSLEDEIIVVFESL